MDLPHELRIGLERELAMVPRNRLTGATAALSRRYRTPETPDAAPMVRSDLDVAAYLAYRLPATFAAIHAVLREVRARFPDWQPRSILDVGAGPGSAAWAAVTVWPSLERVTLLERDADMIAHGKRLMAGARVDALRTANWRMADVQAAASEPAHDLIVAAYVLGELSSRHADLVGTLWKRAAGALVLIEPGTPRGFARIRQARAQLLASGASTIAPCPHDRPCPLGEGDWCHFTQRTQRSTLHRGAKGAALPYEDEKYSYAAMGREASDPIAGRVIRHPMTRPGNIGLQLCTPSGLEQVTVTRKDAAAFRAARHLRWGDAVSPAMLPGVEMGQKDQSPSQHRSADEGS